MADRPPAGPPVTVHAPDGYAPVVTPERVVPTAPTRADYADGFRVVLLQLLTEAFDLYDEEHMWLGYHLERMLEPLTAMMPHTVPLAVQQEVLSGTYSRLMELRHRAKALRGQSHFDATVLHASRDDWATALLAPVFQSYALRPFTEASLRGQMIGLLTELGVGTPDNPRGASFLPADLRAQIDRT